MPKGIKLIDDENKDLGVEDIQGEKILKVFDLSTGNEIEDENGVGAPFKKLSYASELKQLQKGGSNKITIRPRVLTENMQDDTNNIQTLGGSITDVGQVFKLSGGIKEIDRIHVCLEAIAGGAIQLIDDFESYTSTTNLRQTWSPSDTTNTPNSLETSIVQEGLQAMKVDLLGTGTRSKGDDITRTFSPTQDWSAFDGVQLQFRNDAYSIIEFQIEDGSGDVSKITLTVSQN